MSILLRKIKQLIPVQLKSRVRQTAQKVAYKVFEKSSGGKENALLWSYGQSDYTPFLLLQGYMQGNYSVAKMDDHNDRQWHDPALRGIIPIQNFKVRGELKRFMKNNKLQPVEKQFEIRVNERFAETVNGCAQISGKRSKTWLTPSYIQALIELHEQGHAHSVETYQNGELVGGVIGIAINGYFATLTLFHSVDYASKVAFYHLLEKLKEDNFHLHFCGTPDSWLSQYGMVVVDRETFRKDLMAAITVPGLFKKMKKMSAVAMVQLSNLFFEVDVYLEYVLL